MSTQHVERRRSPRGGRRLLPFALGLLWSLVPWAFARGQDAHSFELVLGPESRLWLEGSSNLHEWSCEASEVNTEIQVGASGERSGRLELPREVTQVAVGVPVNGLRCGNSKMEENLRKALKASAHPVIEFRMTRAALEPDSAMRGAVSVAVEGELTVAETTRPIDLAVRGEDSDGTGLRITGRKEILMTEFGVKPPTAMLGMLKTDDRVVVRFELVTSYRELAAHLSTDEGTLAAYFADR